MTSEGIYVLFCYHPKADKSHHNPYPAFTAGCLPPPIRDSTFNEAAGGPSARRTHYGHHHEQNFEPPRVVDSKHISLKSESRDEDESELAEETPWLDEAIDEDKANEDVSTESREEIGWVEFNPRLNVAEDESEEDELAEQAADDNDYGIPTKDDCLEPGL
ncbi:hypothetical protein BDV96DRAFT_642306 [Lophiotrema nucula]|uniref:Uncharacterized protein n=1 Tax=Lophiotrema nucula TaxID=690887 RepID=A0A6A5ZLZ7_9PLEO|nr:hypothetical protein BDV96DRAFT_642306 [Lophiotrema nucula]